MKYKKKKIARLKKKSYQSRTFFSFVPVSQLANEEGQVNHYQPVVVIIIIISTLFF